jgi:hypothetical protein
MKYEVHAIQATTDHPHNGANIPTTVETVGDMIRAKYNAAHAWGGKVVAGYTMRCEPHESLYGSDPPLREPSDFLFLVMELPDDWQQRRAALQAQERALEDQQ